MPAFFVVGRADVHRLMRAIRAGLCATSNARGLGQA